MRGRAGRLWEEGRLAPGCLEEDIVIVARQASRLSRADAFAGTHVSREAACG
jgi:hypothetical protein